MKTVFALLALFCMGPVMYAANGAATPGQIHALATYAKAHGIRWRVVCMGSDDKPQYFGWAIAPGAKFDLYIENGAKDDWVILKPTQAETVDALLRLIHGKPNSKPEHEGKTLDSSHKHCLAELSSDKGY